LHNALGRHDGQFYTAGGASFVPDYKRKAIGSTSAAYSTLIEINCRSLSAAATKIPLNIGRSTSPNYGWASSASAIERLPGAHLTTNEQPEALARLIMKFERGLSTKRN
jgi:lysozyme family protein